MIPTVLKNLRKEILQMRGYEVEMFSGLIKLDANESPYPPPEWIMDALAGIARKLSLNRYPDPSARVLRRLLSSHLGWSEDGLLLGNGSDELIGTLLTACGQPGAVLLIPTPTFSMYRLIGHAAGWRVEEDPLNSFFDLEGSRLLSRLHRVEPRLIIFAYPNNPTGNCFTRRTIQAVLQEAPGLVVVDEAYFEFSGHTFMSLLPRYKNLVLLRTLSKIGLAALRIGVLLAAPELVTELNKVRLPYNVSSFSQEAAALVLENSAFLEEEIRTIIAQRRHLFEELGKIEGVVPYPSDANFVLFRTRKNSAEVFRALRKEGVLVRDLNQPGLLHNCLRVTVGTPEENGIFLGVLREVACLQHENSV